MKLAGQSGFSMWVCMKNSKFLSSRYVVLATLQSKLKEYMLVFILLRSEATRPCFQLSFLSFILLRSQPMQTYQRSLHNFMEDCLCSLDRSQGLLAWCILLKSLGLQYILLRSEPIRTCKLSLVAWDKEHTDHPTSAIFLVRF